MKKECNGQLTISCDRDYPVQIEFRDESSGERIRCTVSHTGFVSALGRLACVECNIEYGKLDRIGKRMENKSFEFKIADEYRGLENAKARAAKIVEQACPRGWTPDKYFSSQNSFFIKGSEQWARCTIRRWV